MADDYLEQRREIAKQWRSTVREHLLPDYRQVAHLADCLSGLGEEVVEANELFSGGLHHRTKDVLIEIADELNEKLSLLGTLPGAMYMGHEANKTLSQMRIACGRFGSNKKLGDIGTNDVAAVKLALERFQVEVKGLEETAAYEGEYDEPTIEPMVAAAATTAVETKRPCYVRDHTMLEWHETPGTKTYRSPAAIRDRWNKENNDDVTYDTVKQAIKTAKKERQRTPTNSGL
jgi:hypothetical protein